MKWSWVKRKVLDELQEEWKKQLEDWEKLHRETISGFEWDIDVKLKPMIKNLLEVEMHTREHERKEYVISMVIDEAEIIRSRDKAGVGLMLLCQSTARMITRDMHQFILNKINDI